VGAAVVVIAVFFTARYLLRERMTVRVVQVERALLVNEVSTNARVEPQENYQFYSPIATTVKAVYVQTGDTVPAGKLLVVLDSLEAQARVAAAESGVKSAQATLDAAANNGTQEERQASAADIAREKLDVDQAQHNLDALTRLASSGAASQAEVTAARQQFQSAQAALNASDMSAHHRYSQPEIARAQAAIADAVANLAAARQAEAQTSIRAPVAGTIYSIDAAPGEYAEPGKLVLQMADLTHERLLRPAGFGKAGRRSENHHQVGRKAAPTVAGPYRTHPRNGEQLRDPHRWRSPRAYRRFKFRPPAQHQRHCDSDHFKPARCPQRAPRSIAL
jgi:HlyD family secretion protein